MIDPNDLPKFDAGTYQKPLAALAEVLAQKLRREATKFIQPPYTAIDMHVMLRVAMRAMTSFTTSMPMSGVAKIPIGDSHTASQACPWFGT
jgi:hypothetical protein